MSKNMKWFGKVQWCEEDLVSALENEGVPVTEENISTLYSYCNHHGLTDVMIEAGWDYIYNIIGMYIKE